jgi:hypothetical protein
VHQHGQQRLGQALGHEVAHLVVGVMHQRRQLGHINAVGDADAHFAVRVVAQAAQQALWQTQGELQAHGLVGVVQQCGQAEEICKPDSDGPHFEVRMRKVGACELGVVAKEAIDAPRVNVVHATVAGCAGVPGVAAQIGVSAGFAALFGDGLALPVLGRDVAGQGRCD